MRILLISVISGRQASPCTEPGMHFPRRITAGRGEGFRRAQRLRSAAAPRALDLLDRMPFPAGGGAWDGAAWPHAQAGGEVSSLVLGVLRGTWGVPALPGAARLGSQVPAHISGCLTGLDAEFGQHG